MVKLERKINHGSTNLSTSRSLSDFNNTSGSSSDLLIKPKTSNEPSKFYRSWSHKLLAPDMYQPTISNTNYRFISKTATWNPAPLYERDFTTTFNTSYGDPRDKPQPIEHKDPTFEEMEEMQVPLQ